MPSYILKHQKTKEENNIFIDGCDTYPDCDWTCIYSKIANELTFWSCHRTERHIENKVEVLADPFYNVHVPMSKLEAILVNSCQAPTDSVSRDQISQKQPAG